MTSKIASLFVCALVFGVALVGCGDKDTTPNTQNTVPQKTQVADNPTDNTNQSKASETVQTDQQTPKTDNPPTKDADVVSPAVVADKPLSADVGQKRYEATCKVCHDQGLLNSPKKGDKTAWEARLAKGKEVLYQHSAKGFNKMPAQAVGDVSEAEVKAAVDYLLEQSL